MYVNYQDNDKWYIFSPHGVFLAPLSAFPFLALTFPAFLFDLQRYLDDPR